MKEKSSFVSGRSWSEWLTRALMVGKWSGICFGWVSVWLGGRETLKESWGGSKQEKETAYTRSSWTRQKGTSTSTDQQLFRGELACFLIFFLRSLSFFLTLFWSTLFVLSLVRVRTRSTHIYFRLARHLPVSLRVASSWRFNYTFYWKLFLRLFKG